MATDTKIVDLFGLPACGKTTLVKCLCNSANNSLKVVTLQKAIEEVRKKGIIKLLKAFSLKIVYAELKLLFNTPCERKRKDIPFLRWIMHGIYYNYVAKCSNYDIVIADNGDIQWIVSIERGEDIHLNKNFKDAYTSYLKNSPVTNYVFCDIDVKTAHERIRQRNRKSGRLDVINEDNIQMLEFVKERERFRFFFNELIFLRKNVQLMYMDKDPIALSKQLLNSLNIKNDDNTLF